ncbi:uncharacterized protein LOC142598655 [Balearica regulorum gibbericeps]|uniref:uncharacterized protein LOC142598655 n=1 Tax=Balearica regulorum gibbericeps TaxID=100784 RepID=UPI003F5E819D
MQAEAVKADLRMLRERLAQCSAESVRHKELLRCLGKKQQELREAVEALSKQNCDVARCFQNNRQELQELEGLVAQTKEHFQMENGEAGVSVEEAQKADLFQGKAEGGTAVPELFKMDQWSELTKALQEQVEVKKLLRNKLQHLQERRECLREPRAFRGKKVQAEPPEESLMQEMVALRLEEQLASRRHGVTSWLRRLLLFLAFLQIAILIVVVLKRDILDWVLPPKLAAAFGSRPARIPALLR